MTFPSLRLIPAATLRRVRGLNVLGALLALVFGLNCAVPARLMAAEPEVVEKAVMAAADAAVAAAERAVERIEQSIDEADREPMDVDDEMEWGDVPDTTGEEIVQVGQSVTLAKDEVVPQVVVTQGSATIDGVVTGDVVVIGGKARINGTVWGNVVNVGRGVILGSGAKVRGDTVGVIGGIRMGTNSVIGGDAVGIIGGITKKSGARVLGDEVPIAFGPMSGPDGLDLPEWFKQALETNFKELVLLGRPLSLDIGWVWVVLAIFLGIYLLFGLLFPSACELTANTFRQRALTSALVGFLMVPLVPLVLIILAGSGVFTIVVPFLAAAVFLGGLFGKAALLLYLGQSIGRQFKTQFPPLLAILVGALPLTLIYLVPFLGLLVLKVTDVWALGAATVALFVGFRKERPPTAAVSNPVTVVPAANGPVTPSNPMPAQALGIVPAAGAVVASSLSTPAEPSSSAPTAEAAPPLAEAAFTEPVPPVEPPPFREPTFASTAPATPVLPEALTLPRVGFKDRFLATCIDWILLALVCGPSGLMGYFMILFPLYFACMWVWRQTTFGGIVLRLKVVRLDGRRMDWPTAAVRAIGALFGSVVGGLGYFWSGWDSEKQGWHDKVAGTVVVKVDKVQPLV